MKNPNALITMAVVSQNADNPYAVICEYIKYCVYASKDEVMTLAEVKTAVGKEFGLSLPYAIAVYCLSKLESEGFISQINHQIKRIGSFDTAAFDREREVYRKTEITLIKEVQCFVKKYGRDWDYEFAREKLIQVLDENGLAYDIFMYGDSSKYDDLSQFGSDIIFNENHFAEMSIIDKEDMTKQPLYSDEFFIGRFIQQTISSDNANKDYLLKICEGLMLCVGAFQMPSRNAHAAMPQIKRTEFYCDTRLLLRFIGCAGEAAVESAKELFKLIQDNGGIICYYPQTLEEMKLAFDGAINNLRDNTPPFDDEMRIYTLRVKSSIVVLQAKKANLEQELARNNIFLRPHETFSDQDNIQFGFDREDLSQFMISHLNWDVRTIENDAYSLWETHMRRKGNYSEYCGSNARLPVFVSTNTRLIKVLLTYRDARASCREIHQWKINRLPVITDVRLMCRLWVPSEHLERLSLINLTANAVAAQRPTRRYLNMIRDLALQLEKTSPEYASIPLPEFFDDNVTDVLLEQTGGNEIELNLGTLASSLDELSEMKTRDLEKTNEQLCSERDAISVKYNDQTKSIIDGAVLTNKNKLGWVRVVIYLLFARHLICALLFTAISQFFSYLCGDWNILFVVFASAILTGTEVVLDACFVKRAILNFAFPRLDAAYSKRLINRLRQAEMPYKEEIVEQAKCQTKLWVKLNKSFNKYRDE